MSPPVKPEQVPHILTGDEWEAAQYGSHRFDKDPTKPMPAGRILTGDEWEQMTRSSNPSKLTFPALPTPKFVADQTKRLNPNAGKPDQSILESLQAPVFSSEPIKKAAAMADVIGQGLGPTLGAPFTVAGTIGRQVVAPIVEHPIGTAAGIAAATASPLVVGGLFAADQLVNLAKYGYQTVHEQMMTPEQRAVAQQDPNRISGEAALVQLAFLGLGAFGMKHGLDTELGWTKGLSDEYRPVVLSVPGATQLGSTAAEKGLPATASPYSPESPLSAAWRDGYEKPRVQVPGTVEQIPTPEAAPTVAEPTVPPAAPPEPVGVTTPTDPYSVPGVQPGEDLGAFGRRLGAAKETRYTNALTAIGDLSKPARFAGDNMEWIVHRSTRDPGIVQVTTIGRDAEGNLLPLGHLEFESIQDAAREIASNPHARPSTPASVAKPIEPIAGPEYKGPVSLYGRLSNDALGAEYRTLLEKRTELEPAAQAPLWTPEREAEAVANIENRRRPDGTLAPADKRALANLQAAQGEGYYVGRHTFESAAAEQRLNNINKHIAGIEQQLANRGLDAAKMMQEPATGGGLTPIEGTGETRTRGLATSTVSRVAEDIKSLWGDLPEYQRISISEQAHRAQDLITQDPVRAKSIAMGDEPAPIGLHAEAVFVALRNKARAEGDVGLIHDLATGGLTEQATTMGQKLRLLAENDPEDPVAKIRRISDKRSEGRGAAKAIKSETEVIAKHTELNLKSLMDFFESQKC